MLAAPRLPHCSTSRPGFTLFELVLVLVVALLIAALALSYFQSTKERAYIAQMMNDLHNYALAEEQYYHEVARYGDSTDIRLFGFRYTPNVLPDSSAVRPDGFFFRVAHTKTKTKCEIDYGLGRANRIRCYGESGEEIDVGDDDDETPIAGTLEVEPSDLLLAIGESGQLQAVIRKADGSTSPAVSVTWTSRNEEIASVNSSGYVVGVAVGTTWVLARVGNQADSARITVHAPTVVSQGLEAYWSTCWSEWGGQILRDGVGGVDGVLGASPEPDSNDPVWSLGTIMLESRFGQDQYISLPGFIGDDPTFTLMFKVKNSYVKPGRGDLVFQSDNVQIDLTGFIYYTTYFAKVSLRRPNNTWIAPSFGGSNPLADGKPHTVAITVDTLANRIRIYVDGNLAGENGYPDNDITVGGNARLFANGFYGGLGAMMYYNRALNATEVQQNHQALIGNTCEMSRSPARIEVLPDSVDVAIDGTAQLTVVAYDAAGDVLPGVEVEWTSSNSGIASVSSTGLVTGHQLGKVWVKASVAGIADSARVVVRNDAVVVNGLQAYWSTCWSDWGGQTLKEILGGLHGTMGSSPDADPADPEWNTATLLLETTFGKDQYISLPNFTKGERIFTFMFRLKNAYVKPGRGDLIFKADNLEIDLSGYNYYTSYHAKIRGRRSNGTWAEWGFAGSNPLIDGKLHTVAIVFNPMIDRIQIYIDGVLHSNVGFNDDDITVGGNPRLFANGFYGGIGAMLYYDRALGAAEIRQNHERLIKNYCESNVLPVHLEVRPDSTNLVPGKTTQLVAMAYDALGNVIPGIIVDWTSSDPAIASVDDAGAVTAHEIGKVWIHASVAGLSDSARVVVRDEAVVEGGLQAYWSTCWSDWGGQILKDAVGGHDGVLGASPNPDPADPTWNPNSLMLETGFGQDQYVTLPDFAIDDDRIFTLMFRLKNSYVKRDRGDLVFKSDKLEIDLSGGYNYYDWNFHARIRGRRSDGTWAEWRFRGANPLADGKVHTVAIVFNPMIDRIQIYIDGVLHSEVGYTEDDITIGGNPRLFANGFYGGIGAMLYYNRALSAEEVSQNHERLMRQHCDHGISGIRLEVVPEFAETSPGLSITFRAEVFNAQNEPLTGYPVTWSIGDSAIATVDTVGVVTGISTGQTWVHAETPEGVRDSAVVIVEGKSIPLDGLLAHWSTCYGDGDQLLMEGVQGLHGVLGGSEEEDEQDPNWWMVSSTPVLTAGLSGECVQGAIDGQPTMFCYPNKHVALPDFAPHSKLHTFIFRVGRPLWQGSLPPASTYGQLFASNDLRIRFPMDRTELWIEWRRQNGTWISPVKVNLGTPHPLSDERLHVLAVVFDPIGDQLAVYLDGILKGSLYLSDDNVVIGHNPILLGRSPFLWVADMLYYPRILSQNEIVAASAKLAAGGACH